MSRDSEELLREALFHFDVLVQHASRDLDDQLVVDGICLRLSAGLEVLNRLDPLKRDELFGADWPLMWGMRNRIAHGYMLVDSDIIRCTLIDDIPGIVARIRSELEI